MLSILIPTYNYVCVKLVTDLQQQAERLECPYEILVADDASEDAPDMTTLFLWIAMRR